MVLGFKTELNGRPTDFVPRILAGAPTNPRLVHGRDGAEFQAQYEYGVAVYDTKPKIHSIREDAAGQWTPDCLIHFATGVRTPNLKMFAEAVCVSTQPIVFRIGKDTGTLLVAIQNQRRSRVPTQGWTVLNDDQKQTLVLNDGFDTWDPFEAYFRPRVERAGGRMDGKLIHWTDFYYEFHPTRI